NQSMMRTRLKPDRRSALLLGAVLVGIVAGGGGLVYQQESQLADVVNQLRGKEKQRDDSARIASRLADTELRYREDTARLDFLQRLAQFPAIVAVDEVQLRPRHDNDHKGGPPKLDVDMQLTAFILKDAPPVPGSAATVAPLPPSTAAAPGAGAPDAAARAQNAATRAENPAAAPPATPKNRAVAPGTRAT